MLVAAYKPTEAEVQLLERTAAEVR
jgi:hypothetical protein